MDAVMARKMWRTLEPYHGLVYFAPEAAAAYERLGVNGRDGYFASRAAAMGAVVPEVVIATFFNFNPELVRHAIPAAWEVASPASLVQARTEAAGDALRRAVGGALDAPELARAAALAQQAAEGCVLAGRPLAAAHAALPWPSAPPLTLWHAITVLRELRGDGHVACLVEAGLSGIDALVLHAASGEVPRAVLQSSRGWSDAEWSASVESLQSRGLVDVDSTFTAEGAALRQRIEDRTDELALEPWRRLGESGCDELRALVRPLSKAIVAGGSIGFRDAAAG